MKINKKKNNNKMYNIDTLYFLEIKYIVKKLNYAVK